MNYYIINNRIIPYDTELDTTLYSYPKLTDEQSDFYELHRCSLQEVLNLKLNEIYTPTLDEVRANKISYFSQLAFDERAKILPEYKLINASLGVYDATETARIKGIVEAFRTEFYRLKALCENANTTNELELIEANYEIIEMVN